MSPDIADHPDDLHQHMSFNSRTDRNAPIIYMFGLCSLTYKYAVTSKINVPEGCELKSQGCHFTPL